MHWIIPNRVLAGVITDHTYETTCNKILKMLETGTGPVHLIIDDSALTKTSFLPLNMLHTANIARHERLGRIVCIGPEDHSTPFVDRVIVRAYRVCLHRCSNLHKALDLLHSKDKSLQSELNKNALAQL